MANKMFELNFNFNSWNLYYIIINYNKDMQIF